MLGSSDYSPVTTTLTFIPGQTQMMTVPVDTIGDAISEGMENFLGVLSNPSRGARIGEGTATVIIRGEILYYLHIQ